MKSLLESSVTQYTDTETSEIVSITLLTVTLI